MRTEVVNGVVVRVQEPNSTSTNVPTQVKASGVNLVNGMVTVGGLTQDEFDKMRFASEGELRRMGNLRHKKMLARRAQHLTNRTNSHYSG